MFPASNHGPGQNIGFPDPCLTPAVPPIVVPYPNFGSNAMAIPTAPNVLVSAMPAQNMGSMPALTNGDNAGCIHPIGMMKPGGTTMGNPMVIINGLPSKHLLCPSQGNLYNNPLGATLIPDVVNVLYCDLGAAALHDQAALPPGSLALTVSPVAGGLEVRHARRGGLASRMGLLPGDLLLAQDGRLLETTTDLLPVLPGDDTLLRVARRGWSRPRLIGGRQAPPSRAVDLVRLGPDLARLVVRRFDRRAPGQVRAALRRMTAEGGRALELDLRGNPGGGLLAASQVAAAFLPAGRRVASFVLGGRALSVESAAPAAYAERLRVLVDGQTASAAELVAAALRAAGRAPLIGRPTWGKRRIDASRPGAGATPVGELLDVPSTGLTPDAFTPSSQERSA